MIDTPTTFTLFIDFIASVCFFGGFWYLHKRCKAKREARFRALEGTVARLVTSCNRHDGELGSVAYRVACLRDLQDACDRLAARVSVMEEILKNHTLDIEVPPPTDRREIYVD